MKHYSILLFFLLLNWTFSFSQDYMDQVVSKACDCVNEEFLQTSNEQQRNLKLGLCWIDAAMPYKTEIKTDYKINLDKLNGTQGEKLGKIIGVKMASACPDKLMKVSQEQLPADAEISIETAFRGAVVKIENDFFVVFSIKDELTGKIYKLLWLHPVKSPFDIINDYPSLMNQVVDCSYTTQELFDPRINEYRRFNVLTEIRIIAEGK